MALFRNREPFRAAWWNYVANSVRGYGGALGFNLPATLLL